jgi:hypothetical protein
MASSWVLNEGLGLRQTHLSLDYSAECVIVNAVLWWTGHFWS